MKKNLLIFLVSITCQILFCQNIEELEFQNTIKQEVSLSIHNYLFNNNEKNIKTLDSLKEIERKLLKKSIVGTWEFFDKKCSHCIRDQQNIEIKKFLIITENDINFYKENISKQNNLKSERIVFTDKIDVFSNLKSLVFKNNSIWDFKVDKTTNFLKIYKSGKETKTGKSSMISGFSVEYYKRITN